MFLEHDKRRFGNKLFSIRSRGYEAFEIFKSCTSISLKPVKLNFNIVKLGQNNLPFKLIGTPFANFVQKINFEFNKKFNHKN